MVDIKREFLCYKKGYSTRKKALTASSRVPVEAYVYKCPKCRYYHLTKKIQRIVKR